MVSEAAEKAQKEAEAAAVLILVVVEDGLRVAQVLQLVDGADIVLILVVVEDGLRGSIPRSPGDEACLS